MFSSPVCSNAGRSQTRERPESSLSSQPGCGRERQQFDKSDVEDSTAMSDRVPVRVQQDPFPDDWGVERLEPFVEENFVILTSRVEIDGLQ